MKSVKFPQSNVVFGADQPQYAPLHAYQQPNDPSGATTMCFELDADELAVLLRTNKLYLTVLTYNGPLQPIGLTTLSPFPESGREHVCKAPPISDN